MSKLTDLLDSKGNPKIAPVQGYSPGIPWSLHLKAYDAYRKKWGAQEAMIDLEGRGCRGGFGTRELDEFVPGWRDEVSETAKLRKEVAAIRAKLAGHTPTVPHEAYASAEVASWVVDTLRYRAFCGGCAYCIHGECTLAIPPQKLNPDWEG